MSSAIEIRQANDRDLTALSTFFGKAYGGHTAFQDVGFLRWYFHNPEKPGEIESIIAITSEGEVVAHYGGLPFELSLNGQNVWAVWGVNAFTLPEWRNRGLGQKLVEIMMERYDVFGVIGFTPKTADFYETVGFNVFGKRRYDRFAYALGPSAWEIAQMVGASADQARTLLPLQPASASCSKHSIQTITTTDCGQYDWSQEMHGITTSRRNLPRLRYRFFDNPYIGYRCLAMAHEGRIRAALFTRQETLAPTTWRIERIVDMFGDPECMPHLLTALVQRAQNEGVSMVDAGTFGGFYDTAFAKAGFTPLKGDDAALLPQVTSPVEPRPNHEFIGIFSRKYASEMSGLQKVHFTRADSDRDRIARLSQIPSPSLP